MNISFQSSYNSRASLNRSFRANDAKLIAKPESFTQNLVNKGKENLKELKQDDDKRYSVLGAALGISILTGLGIALIKRDKVIDFFKTLEKRHKVKNIKTDYTRAHGGPDIDWSKGKRAVFESWEEYINGIKERRSQNHILAKEYKELFAENAETLDIIEKLADARNAGKNRRLFK